MSELCSRGRVVKALESRLLEISNLKGGGIKSTSDQSIKATHTLSRARWHLLVNLLWGDLEWWIAKNSAFCPVIGSHAMSTKNIIPIVNPVHSNAFGNPPELPAGDGFEYRGATKVHWLIPL